MSQFREINDRKSTAPSINQAFNHISTANRMQQPWRDVAKLPNDNRGLPPDCQNLTPFSNINADLYAQALAAKSSLGLLDPVGSPALSALRSYGAARSFSPPTPVTQRQEVSSRTPTLEESLYGNSSQHVNKPGFAKEGFSQGNKDSKAGYQIDFKSALDLNLASVDDEDEFLYGDSTPALPESKPVQPQAPPSNLQSSGANLVSSVKPPAPSRWTQNKPVDVEYPTKSDLHFQAKLQATTLTKQPAGPIKLERKQLYPTGSGLTVKEKAIPVIEKPVEKVKFGASAAEILKQLRLDKTLKELVPQPQPIAQSFSQRKPAPSEVKDTRTSALRVLYDPSENESEIQKNVKDPETLPKNFPSTENSDQIMKEYITPRQENPPKSIQENQIFFDHPAEKFKIAAQIMDRKNSPIYPDRNMQEFWHSSYKDDYSVERGGPSLLSKSHELKFDDHKHESPNRDYDRKSYREISRSPEKSVNQSRSRSPLYPNERNYRTSRNESPNRHMESERYEMKTSDTGSDYRKASANTVIRNHSSEKIFDISSPKETSKSSDSDFVKTQLIDYRSISFNKRALDKYDSTDIIDFDVMRNLDTSIAFTFKNAILDKFTEIYKQKASGSKDGKMVTNERSEAKFSATSNVPKQTGQPMQPYKQLPDSYLQQTSGARESMRKPLSPEPSSTPTHQSSVHSQASKSVPPSREKYGAGSSSSLPMAYPTVQHSSYPPNRMPSGNSASSEKIAVKTEQRISTERYEKGSDLKVSAQKASQSETRDSKGKRPISRRDSSSSSSSESSDSSDDTESLVKQMEKLINRKNDIDKELMHNCKFVSKMKTEKENYERTVKLARNVKLADLEGMKYFQDQYENANSKFKKLAEESKSVRDQIKEIQPKLKAKIQSKPKPKKKKVAKEAEEIQPPPEPTVVFQCFDTGNHWCEVCNESFATLAKLMFHLHEPAHIKNIDPFKVTKDTETSQDKKSSNRSYTPHPVKGVEFMKPVYAYYCSLCEITVRNRGFAELHLKGHDHTIKYQNFIRENPNYENKRDLIKTARIQALVKEKRKKELEEKQAKRPKMEDSPQNAKAMTREEYKDKGKEDQSKSKQFSDSKSSEEKYERKPSTSPDRNKKGTNLPITAPKKNQILIGRAPNFKARPKPTVNKLQNPGNKNTSDKTLIAKAIEEIKNSSKVAQSNKNPAEKNYSSSSSKLVERSSSPPYQKKSTCATRDTQADHQKSYKTKDVTDASMKFSPKEKLSKPSENKMGPPPPLPGNKMGPPPLPGNKMGPPPLPGNKMGPPPLPGNKMGPPPQPGNKMGPPPLPGNKMGPPPLPGNKMRPVKNEKEPEPNKNTDAKVGNKKPSKPEAPKTSDPVINQALKYILHGGKSSDQDLSRIKLPEDSPKNPSPKPPVLPSPKVQAPMTEEEKDFYMLGINKGDMQPLVVPRPPPPSLLQPMDVIQVPPFPPPLTVPPPLSVPPPTLAIDTSAPPPQLNFYVNNPPPVTGVPSASVYPQAGFPNIPPPAVSYAPQVHTPPPRTRSSFPRPSTNLIPVPIANNSAKVVDMEIDDEDGDSTCIIIENAPSSEKIESNAEDGKTIQADAIAVSIVKHAPSDKIESNVAEVEKTIQADAIVVSTVENAPSDMIESNDAEVEKTIQADAIAVSTVENVPSGKIESNVAEVEKTVQADAIAVSTVENAPSDKIESNFAEVEKTNQADAIAVSTVENAPSDKIESNDAEVEKTIQANAIAVSTVGNAPSDKIESNVAEVEKTIQADAIAVSTVEHASSDKIESNVAEVEKTNQANAIAVSTVENAPSDKIESNDAEVEKTIQANAIAVSTVGNAPSDKIESNVAEVAKTIQADAIAVSTVEHASSDEIESNVAEVEKTVQANVNTVSTVDNSSSDKIESDLVEDGKTVQAKANTVSTVLVDSINEQLKSVLNNDSLTDITESQDKGSSSNDSTSVEIPMDTIGGTSEVVMNSFDSVKEDNEGEKISASSSSSLESTVENVSGAESNVDTQIKPEGTGQDLSINKINTICEPSGNIEEKESVKNDCVNHSEKTDAFQPEALESLEVILPTSNTETINEDKSEESNLPVDTNVESDICKLSLPELEQCSDENGKTLGKMELDENDVVTSDLRSFDSTLPESSENLGTASPTATEESSGNICEERNLPLDTCIELSEKDHPELEKCSEESLPKFTESNIDENLETVHTKESFKNDSADHSQNTDLPQLESSEDLEAVLPPTERNTENLEKMESNPDVFFQQDSLDNSASFNTTCFESDVCEKALPESEQCTEKRSCPPPEKSNSGENSEIFESLASDMDVCVDNPKVTCSPQQPSETEFVTSVTEVTNESIHLERNLPSDTCNDLELGEKTMPNLTPCSEEKSPCMASPVRDTNENSEESMRDCAPQLYSSQIIDAEASCESISDLTMDTHDDHMNSTSELNEPINAEASCESIPDLTMDTHDDHMNSRRELNEPIVDKNVTDSDVEMKSLDESGVPEEFNRENEGLSSSVQDLSDGNRSSVLEQTDLQETQPPTNLKTASEMEVDISIKGMKEQEAKAPAGVTIKTEPGLSSSESNLDLTNELAFARALLGSPVVPPVEDSEQNSNSREMLSQTNLNVLLANEQYVGLLQVLREKTRVLLGKEGEKSSSSVGVASPRSMTPSPSGPEVFIKVEGSKPEKGESSTKNPSVDHQFPQLKPQSQHMEADDVQVVLSTEKQTSGADVPVIDLVDSDSEDEGNKGDTVRKNDSDTDEYEAS